MHGYDTSKIGRKIGRGFDRNVFMYGDDHVIKFSLLGKVFGKKALEKNRFDYALCKKYFGDYAVDSVEVGNPAQNEIVELQPFINGEHLVKKHLKNPRTKSQLLDIVSRLGAMRASGHPPLDLMGHAGFFTLCLSNVLVDGDDNLHIIDLNLHEGASLGFFGYLLQPGFVIARIRQEYVLKRLLRSM